MFDVTAYILDTRAIILEGLVLFNLIFGSFVGTFKEGFNPDKFGAWFEKDVLKLAVPYILVLFAAVEKLPNAVNTTMTTGEWAAWGLLVPAVVKVGWSIWVNVKVLFGKEPPATSDATAGARVAR